MLDLRKLAEELIGAGRHCGEDDTARDKDVIDAIQMSQDYSARNKAVVDWLNSYKVLMSFTGQDRVRVADQILGFAAERRNDRLDLDKRVILSEFNKLNERIGEVAPRTTAGGARDVTSLTSKGLWCCYPHDIPIYDRNAVAALGVISRLCRIAPGAAESPYEKFLEVWIRVYREIEPVWGARATTSAFKLTRRKRVPLWALEGHRSRS